MLDVFLLILEVEVELEPGPFGWEEDGLLIVVDNESGNAIVPSIVSRDCHLWSMSESPTVFLVVGVVSSPHI